MSIILRKVCFVVIRNFINTFLKGPRFFKLKRIFFNLIGITVGVNAKIVAPLHINSEAKLEIGEECWIGRDFTIDGNGEVYIGNNCDLAPEVIISTGSHTIGNKDRRAGDGINHTTKIGDSTWIGTRCTIIEGSSVGNSCVLGSCTLVNKDIEENMLVGGVPARLIRHLD
jgi:maltose O-acetyltransferase